MSGTAFDTPAVETADEGPFVPNTSIVTKQGGRYITSQQASTVVRHAREALAAETETKKAFFITVNGENGKIHIAAGEIAVIEAL